MTKQYFIFSLKNVNPYFCVVEKSFFQLVFFFLISPQGTNEMTWMHKSDNLSLILGTHTVEVEV